MTEDEMVGRKKEAMGSWVRLRDVDSHIRRWNVVYVHET
jgi:hypothetical protein